MNAHELALDAIRTAGSSPEVAAIAGINPRKWSTGHFFVGGGQFARGRNIGAMPYIQVVPSGFESEKLTADSHNESVTYIARFYTRGTDSMEVMSFSNRLIRTFLSVLQSEYPAINWTADWGNTVMTPWGGYTDLTIIGSDFFDGTNNWNSSE